MAAKRGKKDRSRKSRASPGKPPDALESKTSRRTSERSARTDSHRARDGDKRAKRGDFVAWFVERRAIIMFVVLFGVFMGAYFLAMATETARERFFPAYLELNADASAGILRLFGYEATARGTLVTASGSPLDIRRGCDAVDPTALFVAAVLAFPARFRFKIPGALIGILTLAVVNLIRIVSLFFVRMYLDDWWFEVMHVDVWQVAFIALALFLWILWAAWATRVRSPKPDAAVQEAA